MTHHARVSIVVALLFSAGLSLKAQVVENDTARESYLRKGIWVCQH